ncbi:MAG: glycosyltransferase family 39 protein, partial [Actinomycetota bacterium]
PMSAVTMAKDEQVPTASKLLFGWGFRKLLLAIVGLAAVIQAIMLASVWTWTFRNGDAIYYQGEADLNAHGHWFVNYYRYLQAVFETPSHVAVYLPTASHPPLTSVFLTLANWVGLTTFREHSIAFALLFLATVAIVGCAIRWTASPRAALLAALLTACSPYLFVNASANLAENLVLFMVAVLLYALFRFLAKPSRVGAIAIGAAAAGCALSRSELALLAVTVVAPTIWLCSKTNWRQRVAVLALAGLGFTIVAGPWLYRNQTTFEKSVWFSDQFGITLLDANCPMTYSGHYAGWWWHACGERVHRPPLEALSVSSQQAPDTTLSATRDLQVWTGNVLDKSAGQFTLGVTSANAAAQLWQHYNKEATTVAFALTPRTKYSAADVVNVSNQVTVKATILEPLDESVADANSKAVAIAFIKAHKVRAAEIAVLRVLRTWNLYNPKDQVEFDYQDARPHVVSWMGLILFYPLVLLSIVGAVARRRKLLPIAPFIGLIITATIAVVITFANGRYRVEGDLALAILGACGIDALLDRRASSRNRLEMVTEG